MIFAPLTAAACKANENQRNALAEFMYRLAKVDPSDNTVYIGWVTQKDSAPELQAAVAFNAFLGNTCQIHVALNPGYKFSPRAMLKEAFGYAFNNLKVGRLIGIVNSNNEQAVAYDKHLGFEEIARIPEAHDDGGDIIVFSMTREQCVYLNSEDPINEEVRVKPQAVSH